MKFTLLRKSVPAWLLLVAIVGAAASISIYVATNLKTTTSQPDFSLTANPSPIKVPPASSSTVSVTLTSLNGLAGNFTTSFHQNSGFYWGASGIPTSILIRPGGTTTFTITITTQPQFGGGSSTLDFDTPLGSTGFQLHVSAP